MKFEDGDRDILIIAIHNEIDRLQKRIDVLQSAARDIVNPGAIDPAPGPIAGTAGEPTASGRTYDPLRWYQYTTDARGYEHLNTLHISGSEFSEVLRQVRAGAIIPAIKLVRGYASIGLKEAKDYVDSIREQI